MNDFYSEFIDALKGDGFEPVKPLRETGAGPWPRLRYMDEKSPSGRYQFHIEGNRAFGTYGSDKSPDGFKTWRSWDGETLKPDQIRKNKLWLEKKRKKAEQEQEKRHKVLASKLTRAYKRLPKAPEDHPYLQRKEIRAHKLAKYRQKTRCLVLPIMQHDGKVYSLQFISEKGDKWFFTGGKVKGGFMPLTEGGEDWSDFYIAESYSTGMTVREAMQSPVICAFNAGNLEKVAKDFRKKHQESRMVIAADNDKWPSDKWPKKKKWVNTGIEKATQAAGHTGAELHAPEFDEEHAELKPTDWNDYACIYGVDKVKSKLTAGVISQSATSPDQGDSFPETAPGPAVKPSNELSPEEKEWLSVQERIRWKGGQVGYFDEKHSIHNAILYLSYHPDWAGTFVYDEFAHGNMIVKPLPWDDAKSFEWRESTDRDLTQLRGWLFAQKNIKISSKGEMSDIVEVASANRSVHPVREYFDALQWDGVKRLDTWIIDYLNPLSGHEEYLLKVAACFLKAAVKRIYYPGTFHKQMLVLEGRQDIGKSTLLRSLATFDGVEYFSDKISFKSIDNPYLCSHLAGRIIIEFPELKGLSMQDRNVVKGWISQTEDEMQPKHKMRVVKYPRQFVAAASTNDVGWMNDPTGGVRFWPVHCGKIDLIGINRVKKQLWAEAVHRVKQGEPHWIEDTDPVYKLMLNEQAQRFEDNVWMEPIAEYVQGRREVSVEEVLRSALYVPIERWTPKAKASVSECLRSLGWDNPAKWCTIKRRTIRKWENPAFKDDDEEAAEIKF